MTMKKKKSRPGATKSQLKKMLSGENILAIVIDLPRFAFLQGRSAYCDILTIEIVCLLQVEI
jgi:hypothetical protein